MMELQDSGTEPTSVRRSGEARIRLRTSGKLSHWKISNIIAIEKLPNLNAGLFMSTVLSMVTAEPSG